MKSFRQLYEDANEFVDGKTFRFDDKESRPFFVYGNELYISSRNNTHEDLWYRNNKEDYAESLKLFEDDFDCIGRLWIESKYIAFHMVPKDLNKLRSMILKDEGIDIKEYKFVQKKNGKETIVSFDEFDGENDPSYGGIHI